MRIVAVRISPYCLRREERIDPRTATQSLWATAFVGKNRLSSDNQCLNCLFYESRTWDDPSIRRRKSRRRYGMPRGTRNAMNPARLLKRVVDNCAVRKRVLEADEAEE
jgi:hypothetical protein